MMNPDMSKMSPDDMKNMMEMTKNIDPSVMQNMMGGAGNSAQMAMAQQQMANMTPEQMSQMTEQVQCFGFPALLHDLLACHR